MARKSLREPKIDTEPAYAYAKTDCLHGTEVVLNFTNVADILEVGEKCFEGQLYRAAKLLFTSISNWARLATTLIYLGENQAAVESVRKAGNTQYEVSVLLEPEHDANCNPGFRSKYMPHVWRNQSFVWWVSSFHKW